MSNSYLLSNQTFQLNNIITTEFNPQLIPILLVFPSLQAYIQVLIFCLNLKGRYSLKLMNPLLWIYWCLKLLIPLGSEVKECAKWFLTP